MIRTSIQLTFHPVKDNHCGPTMNNIPHVMEIMYINKKYFHSVPDLNTQNLPISKWVSWKGLQFTFTTDL